MHSALWEIVMLCCAAELISLARHAALTLLLLLTGTVFIELLITMLTDK